MDGTLVARVLKRLECVLNEALVAELKACDSIDSLIHRAA
jgi:hypothetical protein